MYRRQKVGCGCIGKVGCGCSPRLAELVSASRDLAILDRADPSSTVFSMLPMDGGYDGVEYALTQAAPGMQSVPYSGESTINPAQPNCPSMPSVECPPCPPFDCDKCPVKIVEKTVFVNVPGPPGKTVTVTQYVYVPVPGTSAAGAGYSQSELESIYQSYGGKLPSTGLPDEASSEGSDYGTKQTHTGESKPFPWWLVAVGAAAYFLAK